MVFLSRDLSKVSWEVTHLECSVPDSLQFPKVTVYVLKKILLIYDFHKQYLEIAHALYFLLKMQK